VTTASLSSWPVSAVRSRPTSPRSCAPSVGLRKVLTHAYATIDLAVVAHSIPMALSGYRQFVREVARFLAEM